MNHKIFEPQENLKEWIQCYWNLESDFENTPLKNTIIPDGTMKLIFHYGDTYKHHSNDKESIILPRCFLIGQLTKPYVVEPLGVTGSFVVRFQPNGFFPFANISIKEIQNTAVPLNKLFGKEAEYESCEPTPCLLQVGRRQKLAIKIEHKGYETAEIAINGDIALPSANIDMAIPAESAVSNIGLGMGAGAVLGATSVANASVLNKAFSALFLNQVGGVYPTSGVVAGATATGTGVGIAMVGVDVMSGSYETVYPNPIVIKLAPEGTPTVIDPNMLAFELRQAKIRYSDYYCPDVMRTRSESRQIKCKKAIALDKKRDVENAELLANEEQILEIIQLLKDEIKKQQAEARAQARKKN